MNKFIYINVYKKMNNICTETDIFYFTSKNTKLSEYHKNNLQEKYKVGFCRNEKAYVYEFLCTLCFDSNMTDCDIFKQIYKVLPRMCQGDGTLEYALLSGAINEERLYLNKGEINMTNEFDNETKQIIADLDKQAKEIQAKIDELKSGPKNKNVRWRAEGKNRFFYLYFNSGSIIESEDNGWANLNYQTGNYFKTKEEAENYKKYLINTQKIKDIALRLNNGREIDWENDTNVYELYLDCDRDELNQINTDTFKSINTIYCLSPKFLETCIKEIGEKELIEYIKGC